MEGLCLEGGRMEYGGWQMEKGGNMGLRKECKIRKDGGSITCWMREGGLL